MGEEGSDRYRLWGDPSVRPHHAVVNALAAVLNSDSLDLDVTLYEYLDPEALDALLLHRPTTDVSIRFSIVDLTVTVWIDEENHVIVDIRGGLPQ